MAASINQVESIGLVEPLAKGTSIWGVGKAMQLRSLVVSFDFPYCHCNFQCIDAVPGITLLCYPLLLVPAPISCVNAPDSTEESMFAKCFEA